MKTYEVNVMVNATYAFYVEADSELEAREAAMLAYASDESGGYLVSESTHAFTSEPDCCDCCCCDDEDDNDDDDDIILSEEDGKKIEEAFNVLKMMEEKYGV